LELSGRENHEVEQGTALAAVGGGGVYICEKIMSVLIAWEKNYSAYLNCDNKLII
jgi:hypothetical protein